MFKYMRFALVPLLIIPSILLVQAQTASTALSNNQSTTVTNMTKGEGKYYTVSVPSDSSNLRVITTGGAGDADIYVSRDKLSTRKSYSWSSTLSKSNESILVRKPASGTYYIYLYAYTNASNVALSISYEGVNSVPVSNTTSTFDGQINMVNVSNESGYAYITSQNFSTTADSRENNNVSSLRLFENGIELRPAHSLHSYIETVGKGAFSYWKDAAGNTSFYFSASDNSNPKTNGRIYTYRIGGVSTSIPTAPTTPPVVTTPVITSTKFSLNSRAVTSTGPINVRDAAYGNIMSTQPLGALGTIVAGPTTANGVVWWKVNYDTGTDGWSSDEYLAPTNLQIPTTFSIGNLPTNGTTQTTANITYTLTPSTAGTVYCRRDGYTPIVCPTGSFPLGTPNQLEPGSHTVDFFIDKGQGVTASSVPDKTYTWTITGTTPVVTTPTTPVVTTPTTPVVSGVAKLTKLPMYAWDANGSDQGTSMTGARDQTSANTQPWYTEEMTNPNNRMYGYDGSIAFERNVPDPAGSSVKVNFHRVKEHYADRIGGNRSEFSMIGGTEKRDTSYWFAAAFYVPSSWSPTMLSGDRQLFWQWHGVNDYSPDLSLNFDGDVDKLRWYTTGINGVDRDVVIHEEGSTMPRNTWIKYLVHFKKSATSPRLEVWRGFGNGNVTYTKIIDRNVSFGWPDVDSWQKQGIYKWTRTNYGSTPDRILYTYGEYQQQGENLYDNAVASLADLGGSSTVTTPSTPTPVTPPVVTTPVITSTKFSLNSRAVTSTGPINVRDAAYGNIMSTQPLGALGTIVAGPTTANGVVWWKVNYDTGTDGWSSDEYLAPTNLQIPTTFSIGNLPTNGTTQTTANITHTLTPSTAGTVYCRRDGYTPIVCPTGSFSLGTPNQLEPGSHTVDFFIDKGQGVTASSVPDKSYTWTITATTPVVTTPTQTTNTTTSTNGATPLNALAITNIEAYGYDGSYSGQTITGSDGKARFQPISNVLGTGKQGYLKRIVQGDPISSGSGARSENSWYGNQTLQHGVDYWYSFAMQPIAGEWHGNESGTSQQVIFQIHQTNPLAMPGPTFDLATEGSSNRLIASRVYGPSGMGQAEDPMYVGGTDSRPADGVWTRFVVHLRFSPDTSGAPVIQVWKNGVQIINKSGAEALLGQVGDAYYPKIGFYKWRYSTSDYGAKQSRAAYYSDLYFGQGANLYDQAAAAVAPFSN